MVVYMQSVRFLEINLLEHYGIENVVTFKPGPSFHALRLSFATGRLQHHIEEGTFLTALGEWAGDRE